VAAAAEAVITIIPHQVQVDRVAAEPEEAQLAQMN